jgi:TonB family protein
MDERKPDLRVALARLTSFLLIILAPPCQSGIAAPLPFERPALLAQAAGQGEKAPRAGNAGAGAQAVPSKKITVNVFLLSDQPKNPDEVLESRGSRYTYFSSRRLVSPARPLSEPKPRYPEGKPAEKGGAVLLQLLINERGGLDHIDVVCSAPAFERSALDSLRGMKFAPAQGKDGPVKSYMWVEFAYGRGFPCASVPN